MRVGLTGGLATGKSSVGRMLSELGCFVIQDDKIGHEVMEPGGPAYDDIVREFGREILNSDGAINRRQLGAIVFADPAKLAKLNSLVHPHVKAREKALASEYLARSPDGIAVTEAAILIETGTYKDYDHLIVAVCRPEQQIERAMHRDGLSRDEVLDRLRRQMPLEDKVKHADFVIDTSGTKENTRRHTEEVYQSLLKFQRRG